MNEAIKLLENQRDTTSEQLHRKREAIRGHEGMLEQLRIEAAGLETLLAEIKALLEGLTRKEDKPALPGHPNWAKNWTVVTRVIPSNGATGDLIPNAVMMMGWHPEVGPECVAEYVRTHHPAPELIRTQEVFAGIVDETHRRARGTHPVYLWDKYNGGAWTKDVPAPEAS